MSNNLSQLAGLPTFSDDELAATIRMAYTALLPQDFHGIRCRSRARPPLYRFIEAAHSGWRPEEREHTDTCSYCRRVFDIACRVVHEPTPNHSLRGSMSPIDSNTTMAPPPRPFAERQTSIEADAKELVARFVANEFKLRTGSGLYLDAGSANVAVARVIREQVRAGDYSHIAVVTSNFLVLKEFSSSPDAPSQSIALDIAGENFDPEHLAFVGQAAQNKLLAGTFRPDVVYIGTSGIEFDPHGGRVLLGYHNSGERGMKELLFQCSCKKRVILTTAIKIGQAGGRVLDILSIRDLNPNAPIYLVSTMADEHTSNYQDVQASCEAARELFLGDAVQAAIKQSGVVEFHWMIVSKREGSGNPGEPVLVADLVAPLKVDLGGVARLRTHHSGN